MGSADESFSNTHLAMLLASKKIGGIGEGVLSITVAPGGAECCILRLPEGQDQPNFENQNSTKEYGTNGSHRTVMSVQQMTTTLQTRGK